MPKTTPVPVPVDAADAADALGNCIMYSLLAQEPTHCPPFTLPEHW